MLARLLGAVLLVGAAAGPVAAQTTAAPAGTLAARTDTAAGRAHPNRTPYHSDRTFSEHVLAAPSYALHYTARLLGWAVKEAEEEVPQVFEGRLPAYGLYPIFETGGQSGSAGGLVFFHNDLPWGGHRANVRALVGSRAYNRFEGRYTVPAAFGHGGTSLRLRGRYYNDPRERFYVAGNGAGEDDRAFYATEAADLEARAVTALAPRIQTEGAVRFQRITADPASAELDDEGEERLPRDLPGVGTASLLSVEGAVAFDLGSQAERSVEGTRLRLGGTYAQDVRTREEDVRFVRYQVEAVQFVPLPFLPPQRRLALRGLLEKTEPLGSGGVPFYRQPSLGGLGRLRGYRANRFQDEGALLLTAEYRWPIWESLDAVLFTETGQVFGDYADLGLGRFHVGYGGGLHLVTSGKLAFRFEVAGGDDGPHALLTVQPAF